VLIQWASLPEDEATWEPIDTFREAHHDFQLEDELFAEGGRCYGGPGVPAPEAQPWLRRAHATRTAQLQHGDRVQIDASSRL
jgi:hypothetical protein